MVKAAETKINLLINKLPWIATYSSFSLSYKKSPFEGDYLDRIKNNIFLGLCISSHPSRLADFAWQNIRGDRNLQRWIFGENSKLNREYQKIWDFYQGWYITDIVKGDDISDYFWEKSRRDAAVFQKGGFILKSLNKEVKQRCLDYFETELKIFQPRFVVIFGDAAGNIIKEILAKGNLETKFLELPHRKLEYFTKNGIRFYFVRHYAFGNYIGQLYNDLIGIYHKNKK